MAQINSETLKEYLATGGKIVGNLALKIVTSIHLKTNNALYILLISYIFLPNWFKINLSAPVKQKEHLYLGYTGK